MNKTLVTTTVALLFAAPAFGQDFVSVDTDASGTVTYEEAVVVLPELSEDDFAAADTDQDGALSEEEFAVIVPPAQ